MITNVKVLETFELKNGLVTVLIPTYNGGRTIFATLESILNQHYSNIEIVLCDDGSTDDTVKIAKDFGSHRIRIETHDNNMGYPGNLQRGSTYAKGEFLYLMGQDDLLSADAISIAVGVMRTNPGVGAITRPYFWFESTLNEIIRVKKRLPNQGSETVTVSRHSDKAELIGMLRTTDQLSGLMFRRALLTEEFHPDIFPCHVYPLGVILREHEVAMIGSFTVAVRTESSQSRNLSSIYDKSPVESWLEWADYCFDQDSQLTRLLRKEFCANNAVGLFQIRNYARKPFRYAVREMVIMIRARPRNLISPDFLAASALCIFLPKRLLRKLTDWSKRRIARSSRISQETLLEHFEFRDP